jgi:endonuclease/exonuclease/phosphatase family metal-dependent hydrolase
VALQSISANDYPERVEALAKTIAKKKPHIVALQEMWAFGCTPTSSTIQDPCGLFGPAFNDHVTATLEALNAHGAKYYKAGTVQNLTIVEAGFPVPGVPVFLDNDLEPDIFVTVIDRDVILARRDVDTEKVNYLCARPSMDGCNFENVAEASLGGNPLRIERGFVAVDAVLKGDTYRVVNTHLEVRFPDPDNLLSRIFQSLQATELLGTLAYQAAPPDTKLLLLGDINSDPNDPYPSMDSGPFLTPYQQFATGLTWDGAQLPLVLQDVWTLQRKQNPGFTCCEAADLRNELSINERRVDVIFSASSPDKVKAKVLNTRPKDKTMSGLWPSDHATVIAELKFDDDDSSDDDSSDDNDKGHKSGHDD